MFTVLSKTRNVNPYLIVGIAIMAIILTTLGVTPFTAVSKSPIMPVTGSSEWLDYNQRHIAPSILAGNVVDSSDFSSRHPELAVPSEPIDFTDYSNRHP